MIDRIDARARRGARKPAAIALAAALCLPAPGAFAQFIALTSAETRPEGSGKVQQTITRRADKGRGEYTAWDFGTSFEYGVANNFTVGGGLRFQSIETSGLLVPGYLPGDESYSFKFAGFDISGKHKFLNTAEDFIGLAAFWKAQHDTLDKHSGLGKKVYALETGIALQKYLMEGQLTWRANFAVKGIHATRDDVANDFYPDGGQRSANIRHNGRPATLVFEHDDGDCDPEGESFIDGDPQACFEWPNFPEMELELKFATGVSFRFMNNWYLSLEALYEEEYETEVNRERYSLFAGPGLHFEGRAFSFSVGYLQQLNGGGEKIDPADDLHYIEKTDNEIRIKLAYNF